MADGWFDNAQICLNGHVVNGYVKSSKEFNSEFCQQCGKKTITKCRDCGKDIPGEYHSNASFNVVSLPMTSPEYCGSCGSPYPWTKSRIAALKSLLNELEIKETDKSKLRGTVKDLVSETPKTKLAANRFKAIFDKIQPSSKKAIETLMRDVICESAKKLIFGEISGS